MQQPFTIKNIRIGGKKPVICISVTDKEETDVINSIRDLASRNIPIIEWRVDCYGNPEDYDSVARILASVKEFVTNSILLFTFRTKKQGGALQLEEKKIMKLNDMAGRSGVVDIIDMEFFEASKPVKEIKRLHKYGVKIIASHHDFDETPDDRIMTMLLDQMAQGGADIAKLAVMPNNADDVLRLLKTTNDIKTKYPSLPVVTMSMGSLGVISRVAGETFGSCITFAADKTASAPGQMKVDKLEFVLNALHESINL